MSASERHPAILLPFPAPDARRVARGDVLAVVGGALDAAVVELACVLVQESQGQVDLLQVVEVPIAFPMTAYGKMLLARGGDGPLIAAEQACGARGGESGILLCRTLGPALVAEVQARRSADLVISAPAGGRWARWRYARSIAYVQARAGCRVYIVHGPAAPDHFLKRRATS